MKLNYHNFSLILFLALLMSGCASPSFNDKVILKNGENWKTLLKTSQKKKISLMTEGNLKNQPDNVICAASRGEPGYTPNDSIFKELSRRGLICEKLNAIYEYRISNRELCMQYMTLPSINVYHSAREQAIRERGIDCWKYGNITEERRKANAEFQKALQPQQRAIPQQIIIQQQSNPNACIQDGGGIYCPNYRR